MEENLIIQCPRCLIVKPYNGIDALCNSCFVLGCTEEAAPDMLDMLYLLMPYIMDLKDNEIYKKGSIQKLLKKLNALIDSAEGR